MKKNKLIVLLFIIIVLGYILFPKNIGFTERMKICDDCEEVILGEYSQCLGITLSEEIDSKTFLKCIGIPFGKIII